MARTPSVGCDFTINAVLQPALVGGFSGFPSGGLPFDTINIGDGLGTLSVDTIEHVITHEIGHTIGLRHSDFFDRSISCNGAADDEGDAGIGAIHIPGTPTGATVGGSLMNSRFRTTETGEFTSTDVTALMALYASTDDLVARDSAGTLRIYPFRNNTFFGNGGGTQVGVGFNFTDYLVGNWTGDGTADLIVRDSAGNLLLYPFRNGTFFGNGG